MKALKKIIILIAFSNILLFPIFHIEAQTYNRNLSNSYLKECIELYNNAQFNLAFEKIKLSIENTEKDKVSAKQLYWLALTLYKTDQYNYKKSIELLDSAIIMKPSFIHARFARARIKQYEVGMDQSVIDDYKYVIKKTKTPFKKGDYYRTTIAKYFTNDHETIISDLSSVEDGFTNSNIISPLTGEIKYTLAALLSLNNETEKAVNKLSEVLNYKYPYISISFFSFDVFNLIKDDDFIKLVEKNNINSSVYLSLSPEQREQFFKEKRRRELEKRTADLHIKTIKYFVENKINTWQKKGKFEKTSDYRKRVNEENRQLKIEEYTKQAIDSIGIASIKWNNLKNEYDADNETFRIVLNDFETVNIAVPINDAPAFDKNFNELEFNNIRFALNQNSKLKIDHMEITDPIVGKTYVYDRNNDVPFNSSEFNFNFEDLEVPLDKLTTQIKETNPKSNTVVINVGKSDVDSNIPVTNYKNDLTLALIIGNEDYSRFQTGLNSESNVDYAKRDAEIFSKYANKTLGIPKENITLLKDATSVQMQREIERISELANAYQGEAKIIFYYAGHGFPDEKTKESYIMPVDVSGADVKHGIKLSSLYKSLTKYPTKKVVVILDACFSGGGRNQGLLAARGVRIKPKQNAISGNLVVLTSSTGDQSSLPYNNKQHGMFTYFILKKLKETKGDVSLEELSNYVTKEVSISSLKINSKKQNPSILISPDAKSLWMDWKLN